MTTQLVSIPFHGSTVHAVDVDGKPHVVFRPLVESLGMDYASQFRRLSRKSWATIVKTATVGADGKNRDMTVIDIRTLTMWLATIDENRVSEEARPLVVAYQAEIADVIESYWAQGGAINPRATGEQLDRLQQSIDHAKGQAQVLSLLRGVVDAQHLEAKGRVVLARALGETPEIEAGEMPLYTEDYLREKGMPEGWVKRHRSVFGRRVKKAFIEARGYEPSKAPGEVGGRVRNILAYTQDDRPILDAVWDSHYAETFPEITAA